MNIVILASEKLEILMNLSVELFEDPPDTLHEPGVHGLVVPPEVNPPAQPANDLLPLLAVSAHDSSTLFVIILNSHLGNIIWALDAQFLVNLKLDRQTMSVPSKSIIITIIDMNHHICSRAHLLST